MLLVRVLGAGRGNLANGIAGTEGIRVISSALETRMYKVYHS
jgi:hypothetical protein